MIDFLFVSILFVHFVADFVWQPKILAQNKSNGSNFWNPYLFSHVLIYTSVMFVAIGMISTVGASLMFCFVTFLFHYSTDWVSSRAGKPYWEKHDYRMGFMIVGLDQTFHYLQLWFSIKYIVL